MRTRTAQAAIIALCLCCVFWGFSFPAMQISAASVDRALANSVASAQSIQMKLAIRGSFNGWRLCIAGLICGLLALRSGRYRRREIIGGTVIGLFFGSGMLFQLCGLLYTLPSISSFLTALSVVFAPMAQWLVLRKPVGMRVWLAVVIAMIGMIVLSLGNMQVSGSGTLALSPPIPFLGEVLTVVGAMMFTGHILSVDQFGKTANASRLTTVMLLVGGGLNLFIGIACGGGAMYRTAVLASLLHNFTFNWSFAGLVLVSSVLALQLMNAWQPVISPATAAVVYCLEPVFGTLFSIAFRTEVLAGTTIAGGAIILLAVLTIARRPPESQDEHGLEAHATLPTQT